MIVTSFAPSPTGYLHLGHALAAVAAHDAAKGGRFLLRIEDLDAIRSREIYVDAIIEDLRWLQLHWLGPVLRQSARFHLYRQAIDRLAKEELVYPCFCTRSEIAAEIARAVEAPRGPDGVLYPGTCRNLSQQYRSRALKSGAPFALRLDTAKAAARLPPLSFEEMGVDQQFRTVAVDPLLFGDIVLARKDTPASYHLAVVIDDHEQGVTLVTRGNDLLTATNVQRVLQALLGFETPRYAHHPLVNDESGRKLSKRNESLSLRALRAEGHGPAGIRAMLATHA
jgi:glutamyl-Q tRNA(Asp) synthetase